MKFLADENIERAVVKALRKSGHDVAYVAEDGGSSPDDEVLERARREHRILLTNDKDFGELVFLQRRLTTGVLLLRLEEERARVKAQTVDRAVRRLGRRLRGRFTVVGDERVRSRKLE